MSNIIAIENDGTRSRFLIKNGEDYSYKNVPRGIMRVVEQDDNTITVKLNSDMHPAE